MLLALAREDAAVLVHERDVLPRRAAHRALNRAHLLHDVRVVVRVARFECLPQPRPGHGAHAHVAPPVHPVHRAPGEQRGVRLGARGPLGVRRVHAERDVQPRPHARGEELERAQHRALRHHLLLERSEHLLQLGVREQAGNLAAGEQRVHRLQNAGRHELVVLQVQKRLFVLQANLREHAFQIRAERAVVVARGHPRREKRRVMRVRHQRRSGPASDARVTRQEQVPAGLTQDAVEARDAVQNLGEEQNVQLFHLALVRDELGLDVLLKRVRGHRAHDALVILTGAGPRGEHHVRGARRVDAPVFAEHVAEDGVEPRTRLGAHQPVSERARGFVP